MNADLDKQRSEVRRLNAKRRRLKGTDSGSRRSGEAMGVAQQGRTPDVSRKREASPVTRLTVSEVARTLLNRTPRELSHVTLGRNAKGDTTIEVVFYAGEFEGIEAPGQLRDLAASVYDQLRERYPMESGLESQLRASVAELKKRDEKKPKVER